MRLTVFFLFLLCLAASTLAWAFRAHHLWKTHTPLGRKAALWTWAFAGAQLAGLVAVFLSRNGQPEAAHAWSRPLVTVLFVWYLIGIPMFLLLSAGGLAWESCRWLNTRVVSLWKSSRSPQSVPAHNPGSKPPVPEASGHAHPEIPREGIGPVQSGITRRGLFSTALHSAPALLSLGAPAVSARQLEQFRVRKMEVPLPDLPEALHGFTITHLSDTHVGRFTHGRILSAIVETTETLGSDLICFTGDLINFSLGDLPPGIEMLQALRARHGLYLCEGNHDLMHNATGFRRALEKASLRLLASDSESFQVGNQTVQILGLPWIAQPPGAGGPGSGETRPMQTLARQIQRDAFPILLAHHPHAFDEAQDFRLTLSGHTHGGQLMVTPQFGCGPAFYRYWSGLHFQQNRSLCVSNGVGNWFPIRVSAPAEIIQLTLRPAPPRAVGHRDGRLQQSALPSVSNTGKALEPRKIPQNGRPSA